MDTSLSLVISGPICVQAQCWFVPSSLSLLAPPSHRSIARPHAYGAGFVQLNVGMCLFNLCIPAYPLDGGRIFIDTLLMWEVRTPADFPPQKCV